MSREYPVSIWVTRVFSQPFLTLSPKIPFSTLSSCSPSLCNALQINLKIYMLSVGIRVQCLLKIKVSSTFMVGSRGRCGQVLILNQEVSYCERSVQDVMIEDLQRQVAELTQHLAQTMELKRNTDIHNSESSFENPQYTLLLVRSSVVGKIDMGPRLQSRRTRILLIIIFKQKISLIDWT